MPEPHRHSSYPGGARGRATSARETNRDKEPEGHLPAPGAKDQPEAAPSHRWWLRVLRYGLPIAVVIGGIVVMSFGDESQLEGGAGIVSAGLAIYFVNWLARLSVTGDREREHEEAAREYYTKHGRWPR
jgi:hypothetical protein